MDNSLTQTFVQRFEAAEMASYTPRKLSERCRDYYDSKQYTAEQRAVIEKRGQPVIVDNVIAGKINWLIGQEMNRRTDPKAFPRTPDDEETAGAATDALRFVCDNTNWNEKRSAVWENMLIEGFGGVEVIHEMRNGKPEIVVNHYPWDRLFYDPHSRNDDFSDARYLGAVVWSDAAEIREQYPDADLSAAMARTSFSETYEDRPAHEVWGDSQRDRVRIVLMYYLEKGKWKWVKFSYGTILEEGDSPYVDEDGESVCPLIMQSAYVDRENNRYSETMKLLDQQDEINKRRSKLLHMANSRQTMGLKGAINSVSDMKNQMANPNGHIDINPESVEDAARVGMRPFEIIPTADMATSQFALLQEAKQSVQGMGATESLMGAADGDSGRAVLAKQQGAMQAITPLNDRLSRFTRRVFEAMWNRVRQYWTEERWVRVTDDERNVRFVGLNRQVTLADKIKEQPEEIAAAFLQRHQFMPNDPRLSMVVGVENNVTEINVDIIMEEVPDTVTLAAETFEQIVNIDTARGGVLPIEMIVKASPLNAKVKNEILEYFEEKSQAESEMQQQIQQIQQQLGQMQAKAQIDKDRASAASDMADAELTMAQVAETQAETDKVLVETERLALGYS